MNILDILDDSRYISGQAIAAKLSISRAAVHKQIDSLRAKGYNIAGHRNLGYCIISKPDTLNAGLISARLPQGCVIGRKALCLNSAPSTQMKAKELADTTVEGMLITAEYQSAGYGRLGRAWHSGQGGLWLSIILKPACVPSNTAQIPLVAALAICRSIEKITKKQARIKWPNDIFVDGKKIAGIIADMSAEMDRTNWAIIGIGVNVNNDIPAELCPTAASLKELCGTRLDRAALLASILGNIDELYKEFGKNGFPGFVGEFTERSVLTGKQITVRTAGKALKGVVKGFSAEGALLLDTEEGIKHVLAGDVTIEQPIPTPSLP